MRRAAASEIVSRDGHRRQSATVMVTELITTSVRGRSLLIGVDPLHRVDDLEALHDLTEVVVLRRQVDAAGAADEEELAAVGVRAGVGHGHRADLVLLLDGLVVEAVAGAAAAGAGRVAALAHEAVDDAVEDDAVVVVLCGEEHEVVDA